MPFAIRRALSVLGALVVAATLTAAPTSAAPEQAITITFVRHAESEGNLSGVIDTSVPGPNLTDLGRSQAAAAAERLAGTHPDGLFASTMVRTQQTAQYLADVVDEPVEILPGLREVEAGVYEGTSEADALNGFYEPIKQWLLGNRDARIPGSIDGNEFDARFDEAVDAIYATGDQRPVAFSHGAAIALWTLMNVADPPTELMATQPLNNTGYVVVRGDPDDGWKLVDWNGTGV